jgi:uncharacterized protein DUF6600
MARRLTTKFLATALALSPLMLATTASPAAAQFNFSVNIGSSNGSVSFGYFYNALAPYGRWYRHPRWGDVWHPIDVPRDFRPYYRGHWVYTGQYGWLWESDYEWGNIAFHYGRWVYDPYDGWLWVPGYVWAPAWVIWREGDGNIGWFPMPPDDRFLAGDEIYRTDWDDWDRGFGYSDWYGPRYGLDFTIGFWTFVDRRHFADRDYIRYAAEPRQYRTFINNSRNITNYTTVNNIVVNRSVDVRQIERESGRRIAEVNPRDVIRNAPIMPVQTGRQVQIEERQLHGGNPRASARDRVAGLPPQNVPGQFTPTSPPTNRLLPNQPPPNEQFRGRGRGGPEFNQPNPPPQGQANQPPPNEQFRGRGRGGPEFNQPNLPPPQGQANLPPPNEQFRGRGRGGPEFNQPNPPPPQANLPPPNEQFRGRGRGGPEFNQPNPPPPQGQANLPPPNEQFRGRGRNEDRGAVNALPPPPPQRVNPFQPPPQAAPPSQANVQRGRPPEAALQPAPPPQVQGGPPPNESRQRGRDQGRKQDDQNK